MKRKVCVAISILALLGGAALALDPLGPSATGESAAGVKYSFETAEKIPGTWLSGDKEMKMDVSRVLLYGEYAIPDSSWSVFLQGGPAWGKMRDAEQCSLPGLLNSGFGYSIGGGVKTTFCQWANVDWGALASFSYLHMGLDDQTGRLGRIEATVGGDVSIFSAVVAVGPKVYLTRSHQVFIFGGVMGGWRQADSNVDVDIYGYQIGRAHV